MTIGVLLLATHKYKQFVQPLLNDVKKYFLHDHKVEVHLFTDDIHLSTEGDERVSINKYLIVSWRFPEITLYRYKIFTSKEYPNCDYLFYMDVDMSICDTVSFEIFGDIVATLHPGFSRVGGGSWCENKLSMGYTFPEFKHYYYAGGFQGGKTEYYYLAMRLMKLMIDEDERTGQVPEWHDEGIWNAYLSTRSRFKVLDSAYCCVEQMDLRKAWNLEDIKPKIIALAKDHQSIRQ